MKKGRHRRYEEARKFKQRSTSIEDIDLDTDAFFPTEEVEDEPDDDLEDGDDPWSELAAKYNADDDDDAA